MTATPDLAWLAKLCAVPGVSGDEAAVRALVWERVRPLAHAAWVDPLGSLVVTRNWGAGRGPRTVLAAHLDEVGLILTGYDEGGLLRFATVGGIDPRILPGCRLQVGPGRLGGVVAVPPMHLSDRDKRHSALDPEELRIDIGVAGQSEARAAVALGERVAFAGPAGPFGRLFRAKALDDRAGVVAIVAALEAGLPPDLPLALAFTVQEEIGTRGATAVAAELGADLCVILETTTAADLPDVPGPRRVTRLGAGPALSALDAGMIAAGALTADLARTADRLGLHVQWKEAAAGGTDGARFQEEGAEVAVISVPCRYLHTPASICDPADLNAAARLLAGWIRRRAEERSDHV